MTKTTKKTTAKKTTKKVRSVVLPNGKSPQDVLAAAEKGEVTVLTFKTAGEAWRRAYTFWSLRRTRGLVKSVGVSFDREKAAVTVGPRSKVESKHGATTATKAPKKRSRSKKAKAEGTTAKVASIDKAKADREWLHGRSRNTRRNAA